MEPIEPLEFDAVILAGGKGTRLRSVVADRPKVLAPVAGRPFLTHLLDQVRLAGATRAVLSTGYLAEQFAEAIGRQYQGLPIAYAHEESPLGTGGAIRFAGQSAQSEQLLVMNGDSYCNASLGSYMRWHQQQGNDASLLLAAMPDASRYGAIQLTDDGRVTAFLEKREGLGPGLINAGVYALRREMLERIPEGPCSLERDVMPRWIDQFRVGGLATEGEFIDIGVPDDYHRSQALMERLAGD